MTVLHNCFNKPNYIVLVALLPFRLLSQRLQKMGSEFKCWSLGTFSLQSLYFFEPSQEPKKDFSVTCLKVLLLLSFLCMKIYKKKGWSLLKRMKTFIMFSRLLKSFQLFPMYAKSILLQIMAFPVVEFLVQWYKK